MSLLAIDIGNCNIVATVPRGRGIDVVTSDTSNKQIPCVISYQNDRRFFADQAAAQKISNRNGCFYYLPLILGEQYDSPAVKRAYEIGAQFPLKASPNDGRAIASVYFGDEQIVLETEQMCAAMANKVKQFSEHMDNVLPKDVITTVPGHWSPQKRASMRAAIESTGLNSLGMVSQHIAVGIGYYMRRAAEFQGMAADNAGVKLAILSIGEVESFFAILQMNKTGVSTISCECDQTLGSIDFDMALARLIEKVAQQKCKQITLDELRTKKTQIKIMKAANQLKKSLTMNQKAQTTLECVGDNQVDIPILISLEDFQQAVDDQKLMEKVEALINKGIGKEDIKNIEAIECIGGASRVRQVQTLVTKIFTADKITKRMNPDEAVGFGLGWLGAIRSTKYKIPYDIQTKDLTTNLSESVFLHVMNEKQEEMIKPVELFKNGEQYPKSKKVTLRFQPGKYIAQLREGTKIHEETTFELKAKNFEQFTDKDFAKAGGVDFEDQLIQVKVQAISDVDGYFKYNGLTRNDYELVFDNKTTKVPNENFDKLNGERDVEIAKREEEYKQKETEYQEKLKIYNEAVKAQEEEKKNNKDKKDFPKIDAPEKPNKPINPPEVPKEVDKIEKIPRVANMASEVNIIFVSGYYNVQAKAKELQQFELKCQQIDQKQLQFDAAINALETVIYNARDGIEYGLKNHITEEEAQLISKICDEAHEFSQQIEGKHQIEIIKQKTSELEAKFKEFYDRKQSHADLEDQIYRAKSSFEILKSKYVGEENNEIRQQMDKKLKEYLEKSEKIDQKQVVKGVFDDFETVSKDFEKKLKDNFETVQKKKEEEEKKKKEEEDKKKKEEEEKKKKADEENKKKEEEKK